MSAPWQMYRPGGGYPRGPTTSMDYLFGLYANQGKCHRVTDDPQTKPIIPEVFSRKVFLSSLPPSGRNFCVKRTFAKYGRFSIFRPSKREGSKRRPMNYCFLIFEHPFDVQLMMALLIDAHGGRRPYYAVDVDFDGLLRTVHVRPWNILDANYLAAGAGVVNLRYSLWVTGIPPHVRASQLAYALSQYCHVAATSIALSPKHLYPQGRALVVFSSPECYATALNMGYVQLMLSGPLDSYKVHPNLSRQPCNECSSWRIVPPRGKFFCESGECLSYFCTDCWFRVHHPMSAIAHHVPTGMWRALHMQPRHARSSARPVHKPPFVHFVQRLLGCHLDWVPPLPPTTQGIPRVLDV